MRTLPLEAAGTIDPAAVLDQCRTAIRLERRSATQRVEVRVDAVHPLDPDAGLWRLRVELGRHRRLQRWEGALLINALEAGGLPWKAEVVAADLRAKTLIVQGPPDETPETGMVRAVPFDFLSAPRQLLENDQFRTVRDRFARLLGLAAGQLSPPAGLHTELPHRPWTGHPAWTHGWGMVWGPPGTGKTHTLVEHLVHLLERPDARVLVLATTNRATDEVALRLGPLIRTGTAARVGAADVHRIRQAGLSHLLLESVTRQDSWELAQGRVHRAATVVERAQAQLDLNAIRRGAPRLVDLLHDDRPRCVLTTLFAGLQAVTSDDMLPFHDNECAPFTTVVIDEAGLVPRATAAAVGLLAARQVVLVGDPRQLSPICVAARSMEPRVKQWLGRSGMEHAELRQPATQALLQQRRMHPDISAVVSALQYDHLLDDHPTVFQRTLPAALEPLLGWPRAAWIVLDACEGISDIDVAAERDEGRSFRRPAGVAVLARLLDRYPGLRGAHGLFISPYRGQAAAAEALLTTDLALGTWSASTVHAQQGAEADVVVFDLVRHGGWAAPEWRRLVNVALSRARHQLLFIAAENELQQPWLTPLRSGLTRCRVTAAGALRRLVAPDAQPSLFSASVDAVAPAGKPVSAVREPPAPPWSSPRSAGASPVSLGAQIAQGRAARRSLTRAQAQLVRRELTDLGPRVVRGVAGSGKTIVLARWAALELYKHDREATIVYGNTALRPHLEGLLCQAWRVVRDDPAAQPPLDRVHFQHVGTLLRGLLAEAGLPAPTGAGIYDVEAQARALQTAELAPRFGLLYIDEAQDLGHATLALLLSLVEPAPTVPGAEDRAPLPVRIFYDNAQNIYRRSTPRWSEFGLDMRGRATVLRESFRATRPAMELALDVLHQLSPLEQDRDFRELISPRRGPPLLVWQPGRGWRADFCVVQGQAPEVALHATRQEEHAALVQRVRRWLADEVAPGSIRVLAPTRARCTEAAEQLQAHGIPVVHATNSRFDPRDRRVVVTTPHSFKGYEAELVAAIGLDGYCNRDGQLLTQALYVALTRARTWMWVSATRVGPTVPSRAIVDALAQAVAARPERQPVDLPPGSRAPVRQSPPHRTGVPR